MRNKIVSKGRRAASALSGEVAKPETSKLRHSETSPLILTAALRDLWGYHRRATDGSDHGWTAADMRRLAEIEQLAGVQK